MPAPTRRSAVAFVLGALVVAPMVTVAPSAAAAEPCAAYSSPLDCVDLVVDPVAGADLTFDGGAAGGIVDGVGVGTGFTLVQPSNAAPQYMPERLAVAGGQLRIAATPGIQFRTVNTLDNGLGVALPTPTGLLEVTTTLADLPAANNQAEQAGVWLGRDQDNLTKLVVIARAGGTYAVQLAKEAAGVSNGTAAEEQNTLTTYAPGSDVALRMVVNPVTNQVTGHFSVNGGAEQTVGPLVLPPGVLTDLTPAVPGAGTAAGVFATTRNRTTTLPTLTYAFDGFSATEAAPNPPPAAPATVTATGGVDDVLVTWDAVADSDLASYRVYTGPTSPVSTTGTPLATLPVGTTSFVDETILLDRTAAYAVVAVDEAGNPSPAAQAAGTQVTGPEGDPFLAVDIHLAAGPGPVAGYVSDTGLGYSDERGYGWLSTNALPARQPLDASVNTRQRPSLVTPFGQRRAGLIHLQYPTIRPTPTANGLLDDQNYWEAAVPDGTYAVTLSSGDETNNLDSKHTVRAEATTVIDGFSPTVTRPFDEATAVVEVTDGYLTIQAVGASADRSLENPMNAKLSSIEILQVEVDEPADTTAPAVPAGLAGTAGDGSVELSWDAVADEDVAGYRVFAGPSGDVDLSAPVAEVTGTTSTVEGLTNGTAYDFVVVAFDTSDNVSDASAPLTLTPEAPADTTAPAVPAGLAGTAGDGSVELSWDAVADEDVAGYRVFAGPSGDVDLSTPVAEVTGTTSTVEGLTNGTAYDFVVVAFDTSDNVSDASAPLTLTPEAPADTTAPAVPAGLAGTAGDGSVELSWDAVADEDVAGYRVFAGPSGDVDLSTPVAEVTGTTSTVEGLTNGTAYDFVVVAFDTSDNVSDASAPLTLTPEAPADTTPPAVPTGLALEPGDGQIVLTWEAVADAASYRVLRGTMGVLGDEPVATVTEATWTDTDVVNGVDYVYAVIAVDEAGNASQPTLPVEGAGVDPAVTLAPVNLSATLEGTTATITWDPVEGATYYDLYERGEMLTGAGFDDTLLLSGLQAPSAVVDDLVPGSTVAFVVTATSPLGTSVKSEPVVVDVPLVETCAAADGWTAQYYDNRTLSGVPTGTRCDAAVAYDFGLGGPVDVGVGVDDFSVRWTREIVTGNTTYAFSSRSDDGLRIYVDDELVLDEFVDRGASAVPAVTEVPLSAGTHTVVVEYYEAGGGALVEVSYAEVPDATVCAPDQWLAQYFDGQRTFSGSPAGEECVDAVNEDWGSGGPEQVGSNDFSVRWTTTRTLAAGTYELQARSDDGIRIYVDGDLVIDEWRDQGPDQLFTEQVTLGAGEHTVRVDYYENGGGALARVGFSRLADEVTCTSGWRGEYFTNQSLDGSPVRVACDDAIAFDYGLGGPAGVGVDDFSVRWTREITTVAGTYAFSGRSDDGLRVTVDGLSVIDEFVDRGAGSPTVVEVPLSAGTHTVVVEYYENGAGALVEFDYDLVPEAVTCLPGQWTAQYFQGRGDFGGAPAASECVDEIDEDWGSGGPGGVGNDDFSARWTTSRDFEPGTYELRATSDDGIRAYVDGVLVMDEWRNQGADQVFTETVSLAGSRTLVVEYYEAGGGALARFDVERLAVLDLPPAAPAGLAAAVVGTDVVLDWDAVAAPDLDGYRVYRSESSPVDVTGTPLSGEALLTLTGYTDTTAVAGTEYFYAVVAVDQAGQASLASPEVSQTVPEPPAPVSEAWNFQPAAAPVPAGFSAETGAAYSTATGRGWVTQGTVGTATPTPLNLTLNTRDRNRAGIAQELDTMIHLQYGDIAMANAANGVLTAGAWERDLPNGTYEVSVSVGDQGGGTSGYDSSHVVRAEGQVIAPAFVGSASAEYRTSTGTVVVDDGRLSIDAIGGTNTKLNWIRISTAAPDTTAPAKVTDLVATGQDSAVVLGWAPSASVDTVGYRVYRSQSLPVPTVGDGIGGTDLLTGVTFTDTTAVNLTSYRYAVVAFDAAGNASETTTSAEVTPQPFAGLSVGVDFGTAAMTPQLGYVLDHGQAYGARTLASQGTGLTYGWVAQGATTPLSLVGNGRVRTRPAIDPLLNSMIHAQYGDVEGTNGVDAPGAWEIQVPDGVYEVSVTVGDEPGAEGVYDSSHVINIESQVGIELFQATASEEYRTTTAAVRVEDGRLTVSAVGGTNTKLTHLRVTQLTDRPAVVSVNPANRATAASTTAGVATSIAVPGDGVGVDPTTISGNVSLVEVATGQAVAGTSGSSGGNDVINFSPTGALKPNTAYRFSITSDVLSEDGTPFEPFTSVFTTGDGVIVAPETFTPLVGVGFEKVRQDIDAGYIASMQFGPDGKLYASSIGGSIKRYDVAADGTLSNPQQLAPALFGRAVIGMVFDESATASDLKVWVTHATADLGNEQTQWSSKVSYLTGPTLGTVTDVFVGLPRSNKDHLSNSIGYGPGGDLYFLQGSNQAAGDPDGSWGTRGEKLLTAALLKFDPDHPAVQSALAGGSPVDVQTDGIPSPYNPYATGASLKIHATGIRNAYDFNYHSNGHIYVPTNGTASGGNSPGVDVTYSGGTLTGATRITHPNTPNSAQLNGQNLLSRCQARTAREPGLVLPDTPAAFNHPTQRDFLFDAKDGGYFGHPNPERCEFVLNNGSASSEGGRYTTNVPADPNYRGVAYDFAFNKSPNGVIEYSSDTFGGQLKGRVVVVRFSNNDDLTFLQVDQNTGTVLGGQVQEGITGVPGSQISGVGGFNDPLEVIEDPRNGNLYVNSYDRSGGQQGLFLLRVPSDQQAPAVETDVDELVFEAIRTQTDSQQVVLTNSGPDPVTLASTVTGTDAAVFSVQSGGSGVLQPGASTTVTVQFAPGSSTTVGYREAALDVAAGDSSVRIGLYGLSKLGQEGGNEPTLSNVLRTLGHPVNTGWTGLAGGVDPAPKGDEIEVELFQKAGTAPVGMTPIAAYAPFEVLPFGWYDSNATLNEVGALDSTQLQTLYPTLTRGGTSFDPGSTTFGLYYDSNTFNRVGYTEDVRNAFITPTVAHRVRIYEATRRDGSTIANAYIIAFEDASNGDYQDYVFLLTGVRPAGADPGPDPEPVGEIRVNFQSAAAPVPTGYLRDHGQPFAFRTGTDQGDGSLRYGWIDAATQVNLDLSVGGTTPGNGRDRNLVADQRLDTLMHMQATDIPGTFNGTKADGAWEIEVPNGSYRVTVAVGDPATNQDAESHTIDVEDVRAVNGFVPSGTAAAGTRSTTATVDVEVIDERLTLDATAGTNTKVHFVDIVPLDVAPEPDADIQVNFQAAGAPTVEGWTPDDGLAFTEARGFGWVNLTTRAPVDRTAAARTRAGIGPVIDRTLNIMQSDVAATAAPDGAWEYVVPNGAYNVQVSVGDPGFSDSVHSISAEGVRIISQFVPDGLGDFQVSDETVNVSDGRLTIEPGPFGSNTKIQWVRVTAVDPATDLVDPVVSAVVTGDAAPGGGFYDEATVTVTASDTGGSGLAGVTVSVDGGPAQPYTAPLAVTGAGPHTVTVVATDGAGNTTTEVVELLVVVVVLNDGVLTSQNPEAAPFADRYVMSRTESTVQSPSLKDTTTIVLRNTGTEPVVVSQLLPPATGFVLEAVPTLPVTVPVNGLLQVGVRFNGTSPNSINRIFEDTVGFVSDAANGPLVTVEVAGIAQDRAEGGTEPNVAQIAEAFGLGTDIIDPTSTRSAAAQLNNQGRLEALGDEVLSPYWARLNSSQPVTVRQLAAYHSCCASTATFFTHAKASNTTQTRLTHNGAWAQTLLPRINGSTTNPAFASFTPASQPFGFKIDPEWSDPSKNNKSVDQCPGVSAGIETATCTLGHHLRIWPVEDREGVAVPGQYLVVMDYSGINYDFNDNVYLVTNITPEDTTAPDAPASVQAALQGSGSNQSVLVSWSAVQAADLAGYHVERSSGPSWARLTTAPVGGTTFSDTSPPAGSTVSYRVLAVDTNGNTSAPTASGPVSVPVVPPTPGFTPIRVNAGGPAATVDGVTFSADTAFSGGKSYSNPAVTQIAGTTADVLYLTERSATTNLGTFSYAFPVPAGSYDVRLHFAEIYHGATGGGIGGTGKRVLSVNAEGGPVEVANLDLNAVAAPMTAVVRDVPVTVSDGTLNLSFTASVNQPKVSAIEVVASAPAFTPVRLNAGGPAVSTGGISWAADTAFTGGKSYTNPAVTEVLGTTDDVLYRSERSSLMALGSFSYQVPVPAGTYRVRLHFAEIYHGATGGGVGGTGKRVFSVNAEGGPVEVANLDLNAVTAPMTAVIREFDVPVADGSLDLVFSASVDQPKISAIEVLPAG